jgi:hypothetical protein
MDEPTKLELTLTDKITARTRLLEANLFNPANTRDVLYTKFQRIRLIEPFSNTPVFMGRLDIKQQDWDDQWGQLLKLGVRDYLSILTDRFEYDDRRVTAGSLTHWRRSDLIRILVHTADKYDDLYHGEPPLQDSFDEFEVVGGYQGRDYRGSKLSVSRVIEDLAAEDSRATGGGGETGTSPLGWDFYVDDGYPADSALRPGFHYFPRYSLVAPITLAHKVFSGTNVIPIFPDYKFSDMPIEHKNLCVVRSPSIPFDVEVAWVEDLLQQNAYHAVKEMIVEDASIPDVAAAWQRGRAELTKTRNPPLRGEVNCQFYPTYISGSYRYPLRAGQVVRVIVAEMALDEDFLVLGITYKEPPGACNIQLIRRGAGTSEVQGAVKEDPLNFDKRLRELDKEIKYVSWTVHAPP